MIDKVRTIIANVQVYPSLFVDFLKIIQNKIIFSSSAITRLSSSRA